MKNPTVSTRSSEKVGRPSCVMWVLNAHGIRYVENGEYDKHSILPEKMIQILESHGLKPEATQLARNGAQALHQIDYLLEMRRPIILFVRDRLFPHWVILCGNIRDVYYLYDPSVSQSFDPKLPVGSRAVRGEELLRIWGMRPWSYVIPWWRHIAIMV